MRDAHLDEAHFAEEPNQLCLRQSTCDSTGPQIDVAADLLRELAADDDVAELKPSARTEHARDLFERGLFVRHQVEDACSAPG
jgi:hypothetical protein